MGRDPGFSPPAEIVSDSRATQPAHITRVEAKALGITNSGTKKIFFSRKLFSKDDAVRHRLFAFACKNIFLWRLRFSGQVIHRNFHLHVETPMPI